MLKILYLILFYLIYRITDLVLLLVVFVQTLLNIASGEPSQSIKEFGKSLGVYLQQISEYLSYASDEKPYPFSDWPTVMPDDEPLKTDIARKDEPSSASVEAQTTTDDQTAKLEKKDT